MPRLAVARLWFCSNSFTPRRTRAEDLFEHEWAAGAEALDSPPAPGGKLGGVRNFLAARPGWEATMLRCASAPSGGPLSADIFGSWMVDIEAQLHRGRFDAVYLSLHGACQAEGDPAADLTILRRVRTLIGHTPLVASFDLRANLSEETAILLDGASANRAWPPQGWTQGGGDAAAMRALAMLEGILSGRSRPVGALARVPMVLDNAVLHAALGELWREELPRMAPPVLDASVFGGFAWGDSPHAGPSALVWADRDAGLARETAARLAMRLARWRARPVAPLLAPAEALAWLASRPGPAVLLDPSDDPAAGGLADTPELLRVLLAAAEAGALTAPAAFAALHDPDTVQAARAVGLGHTLQRALGGLTTSRYGMPVAMQAEVCALRDTRQGGLTAVLRAGGLDVLVTSRRPALVDPSLFREAGITPESCRLLAVKGGPATQMAFGPASSEIVACEAPGPAAADLMRLPYHYVPASRRVPAERSRDERRGAPDARRMERFAAPVLDDGLHQLRP